MGDTYTNPEGYVEVCIDPDDPLLSSMAPPTRGRRWLMEHRAVMAHHLGRPLTQNETVHHLNGIRDDNRLENLELWQGAHGSGVRADDPHCATCRCQEAA